MRAVKTLSIALVVILGFSTFNASAESTTADVAACINKNTGTVRIAQVCSPRETPFQWIINGLTGKSGPRGAQILTGKDAQELATKNIGEIGDFYISSTDSTLYGPKSEKGWSKVGIRLQGAAGANGANGAPGAAGRNGANGAPGAAGANGAPGAAGSNGVDGNVAVGGLTLAALSKCGSNQTTLCKVGGVGPGGGTIFFVDYNDQYSGFNFLEAAPAACETTIAWSSDATRSLTAVNGWAARAVGRGQANTTAMLANGDFSYVADTSGAAFFANALAVGNCVSITNSKDDWFLGSLGEMKLMYDILQGVGGFDTANYWSSSGLGLTTAWHQNFYYGYQDFSSKTARIYVRPVRAFS